MKAVKTGVFFFCLVVVVVGGGRMVFRITVLPLLLLLLLLLSIKISYLFEPGDHDHREGPRDRYISYRRHPKTGPKKVYACMVSQYSILRYTPSQQSSPVQRMICGKIGHGDWQEERVRQRKARVMPRGE